MRKNHDNNITYYTHQSIRKCDPHGRNTVDELYTMTLLCDLNYV